MTLEQSRTFILTLSVLCSGAASCFFVLLGAGVAEEGVGFTPLVSVPMFLWAEWGVLWGGFCGWFWGRKLILKLGDKQGLGEGLRYGLFAGVTIGTVNAVLTGTFPFGFVLGLFLGPGFGLGLAFLGKRMSLKGAGG